MSYICGESWAVKAITHALGECDEPVLHHVKSRHENDVRAGCFSGTPLYLHVAVRSIIDLELILDRWVPCPGAHSAAVDDQHQPAGASTAAVGKRHLH